MSVVAVEDLGTFSVECGASRVRLLLGRFFIDAGRLGIGALVLQRRTYMSYDAREKEMRAFWLLAAVVVAAVENRRRAKGNRWGLHVLVVS